MKNKIQTLEMVRQIRDDHAKQLEGKTVEEQMAFYKKKSENALQTLAPKIKRAQQKASVSAP
jgi:hypothetical protein